MTLPRSTSKPSEPWRGALIPIHLRDSMGSGWALRPKCTTLRSIGTTEGSTAVLPTEAFATYESGTFGGKSGTVNSTPIQLPPGAGLCGCAR